MGDDSTLPSTPRKKRPLAVRASRKLKDFNGWSTAMLVIAVALLAGAVATRLATLTGWANSGAGAALTFIFVAAAAGFASAREELAERTAGQALLVGAAVVATAVIIDSTKAAMSAPVTDPSPGSQR